LKFNWSFHARDCARPRLHLIFQKFVHVTLLGLVERVVSLRAPDGLLNANGFAQVGGAPVPERAAKRDDVFATLINGLLVSHGVVQYSVLDVAWSPRF
jgi:hypothetical protein